ncbi:peptidoglycan-binding protein [Streptomyces coerulescens]|uniref:Peptidoglycan-binding protein n=1 Tax=Streptomyces coerulescens TaxID=29304 RepID=A0ABW0CRF8_STRCD
MEARTPVFEEIDPGGDCDCPGCVHWRRVLPHSTTGRHPAAYRALLLAAAASTTVVVGHTAPALAAPHTLDRPAVPAGDEPNTPQGGKAPLHGPGGKPAQPASPAKAPATTRAEIIKRAKKWVTAKVPYSMSRYWSDGYRQDCSGFVSMAWSLPGNEWTGSLGQYGVRITKAELQPGDMLLFHNLADPQKGSHVVIFGGWTDHKRTHYSAYELAPPHARRKTTPYAYWKHSDRYVAYRYKGLTSGGSGKKSDADQPDTGQPDPTGSGTGQQGTGQPDTAVPASLKSPAPYPGRAHFGPGVNNKHVTELGRMLVERGAGRYYTSGPGPRWTGADRRATRAFQLAQGWRGRDADGLPGPDTWALLATGKGKDIPAEATGSSPQQQPSSHGVPGYPGRALFRPGAENPYVTQLGRQLVTKGFGKHYRTGPGPRWSEADRRAVEAFQRAQGWRGGAADGYPGPETWRRLFA